MEAHLARKHRVYYMVARVLLVERQRAAAVFTAACDHVRSVRLLATEEPTFEAAVHRAFVDFCAKQPGVLSAPLMQQLATHTWSVAQLADLRPTLLLDEWKKLPPVEQALLQRVYEHREPLPTIAAAQQQTPPHLLRELSLIHVELLQRLQNAQPDEPFTWPTNGHELTRLTLQRWVNHEPADAVLVLESLLLSDPPAQAFYLRLVALLAELDLRFHELPPLPPRRAGVAVPGRRREQLLTVAFVLASVLTLGYVLWVVVTQWRK